MPTKISKVLIASLVTISLCANIAYAWNEPTTSPSSGNVPAPINTGADEQTKSGDLLSDALGGFLDLLVSGNAWLGIAGGKVGIGTQDPENKFTILPSNGDGLALREEDDGFDALTAFGYADGAVFNMNRGGNPVFHIDSTSGGNTYINNGNVGIGTAEPDAKLDVVGKIYSKVPGVGYNFIGWDGEDVDNASYLYAGSRATGWNLIGSNKNGTGVLRGLGFTIGGSDDAASIKMAIDTAGNVGIGTTDPTSYMAGTNGVAVKGANPGIAFSSPSKTWLLHSQNADRSFRLFERGTGVELDRITVLPGGNVGIGTDTPATKLQVVGGDAVFSNQVIVGYNGNSNLFTRHINGKQVGSNTADTLYVNHGQSGFGMNIGSVDTNNNPLNVYGPGAFSGLLTANGGLKIPTGAADTKYLGSDAQGNASWKDIPAAQAVDLTNLDANNLTSGTIPSGRLSGSYTGITSVGKLASLAVTGDIISDALGGFLNLVSVGNTYLATSGGGVGIGTNPNTNPATTLEVFSGASTYAGNGDIFLNKGTGMNLKIGTDDTNNIAFMQSHKWSTGYSPIALNPNGGNVGIGTDTPATKLQVVGGDAVFSNQVIVGYNGNSNLFTRHINGKQVGSNTADTLYVNHGQSGFGMNIGSVDTNNNPLNVYGPGAFSGLLTANGGLKIPTGAADTKYLGSDAQGNASWKDIPAAQAVDLTNLDANNLTSGTVPSARISGSYSGITGVGTITSGTWNGTSITDANISSAAIWNAKAPAASPTFTGAVTVNGNTSITGTLDVTGNVTAGLFTTSDRKLKKNIAPLSGQLEKISQLQGVSFDWKKDDKRSLGLIAQDVEKVYPDLVSTDKTTGLKAVGYSNLVAPLIEAVKELKAENDLLKARIEKLENK